MAKVQSRKAVVKKSAKKVAAKKIASKKVQKAAIVVKRTSKIVFKGDVRQTATLVRVGRAGAANAIRASKALGLPITYMERGAVIQELPNGVKKIVTSATKHENPPSAISLKKGMIFHAKK